MSKFDFDLLPEQQREAFREYCYRIRTFQHTGSLGLFEAFNLSYYDEEQIARLAERNPFLYAVTVALRLLNSELRRELFDAIENQLLQEEEE